MEIDDSVPEACKDNKKKIKDTIKRCGMKLGKKKPSGGNNNKPSDGKNKKPTGGKNKKGGKGKTRQKKRDGM